MVSSSEKQEAMEGVFHALWHLMSSNPTDALESLTSQLSGAPKAYKPRSSTKMMQMVISMSKRLEEFDAKLLVGNEALPLVHALASKKDISIPWLEVFKQAPEEYLFFDKIEGKTIGGRFFDRMMKGANLHVNNFKWWIENAPSLDASEAAEWVDKLTSSNKKNSGYSSSTNEVEGLLKALLARGAKPESNNPLRPQERWSNSSTWWENIFKQNRAQETVRCASGQLRTMEEALVLHNLNLRDFSQWKTGQSYNGPRSAPHGRSKELVEHWVLGGKNDVPIKERVERLILSIDKTDRVMDEVLSKARSSLPKDKPAQDLLRQILDFRTPAGMSLRGQFALKFEGSQAWNDFDKRLLGDDKTSDFFVDKDGAGLLLQEARASILVSHTSEHHYRSISGLKSFAGSHAKWKQDLMGEESRHQELVDLLVDGIVSRKPYHHFVEMAKFIVDYELLNDQALDDKLKQAISLSRLPNYFTTLGHMQSGESQSRRPVKREWISTAADKLENISEDVDRGAWQLSLSDKDWGTLSEGWGMSKSLISYAGARFASIVNKINTDMCSIGHRLEIQEATSVQDNIPSVSRPRL